MTDPSPEVLAKADPAAIDLEAMKPVTNTEAALIAAVEALQGQSHQFACQAAEALGELVRMETRAEGVEARVAELEVALKRNAEYTASIVLVHDKVVEAAEARVVELAGVLDKVLTAIDFTADSLEMTDEILAIEDELRAALAAPPGPEDAGG